MSIVCSKTPSRALTSLRHQERRLQASLHVATDKREYASILRLAGRAMRVRALARDRVHGTAARRRRLRAVLGALDAAIDETRAARTKLTAERDVVREHETALCDGARGES